jgi:hypothetical protein
MGVVENGKWGYIESSGEENAGSAISIKRECIFVLLT